MSKLAQRSWPVAAWPIPDGPLWLAAKQAASGRRLLGRGLAGRLRPATLRSYEEAYGAWIATLAEQGELDEGSIPADRVTPERLDGFVASMAERGNRGITIKGRLLGLYGALRILAPDRDWRWVARPGGASLDSLLDTAPRGRRPRSARELFDWGMAVLEGASACSSRYEAAIALRDGLIIALLAARAMRVGELQRLNLGGRLVRGRGGQSWRMEWVPEDRKAGGTLGYAMPEVLVPHLERYLRTARPLLLRGRSTDAVWISLRGGPLAREGLQAIILRRSARRFGGDQAFGPHVFRHALTTSTALDVPETPGLSASILGHGLDVSEKHYNRAGGVMAAQSYGEVLDDLAKMGARELARLFRREAGEAMLEGAEEES